MRHSHKCLEAGRRKRMGACLAAGERKGWGSCVLGFEE
jgi:hypothetical protein